MAYIDATSVKQIRDELKAAFPKFKFGVRKGSGSLSVDVTIKAGPTDFSSIFKDEYSQKKQYAQLNIHWLENFYGEHAKFFGDIVKIIKTAPARADGFHKGRGHFDESDAMIDYFHCAYYIHLNIGAWDKPYELTK